MKFCFAAALIFVSVVMPHALAAGDAAADPLNRLLLVRNGNSPVSRAIAADYARRRGVRNVLTVMCQDSALVPDRLARMVKLRRTLEQGGYAVTNIGLVATAVAVEAETIDFKIYRRDIEKPIRAFLTAHPGIDFIVLTKGIPIRLTGVPTPTGTMRYSLDSYLAALDYDQKPGGVRVDIDDPQDFASIYGRPQERFHAWAWSNRFWNSTEPFSHAKFGGYLVTRLDGWTQADAEALTTRSLTAAQVAAGGRRPEGKILLVVPSQLGFEPPGRGPYDRLPAQSAGQDTIRISEEADTAAFDSDMQLASQVLRRRHMPVDLEVSEQFARNRSGLMGYISYGSNDPNFNAAAYHSLTFAPGAIAETAVSTSARTLLLPTYGGQSLLADLIAQGATGVKGYTDEPLLQAVASPSILFDRYTHGWTLAESFYAASALVGWEDVVIGDPLARAYPEDHGH